MNNKKATKRALLTSVMALAMCVVMLVGTTFAWFTDTAKTNVNKIQAGKLDVALEMKNPEYVEGGDQPEWINAENGVLNFMQADAEGKKTASESILWEPGCTYELPALRVINNGNLALKYKIQITGAKDADNDRTLNSLELLDVLTWTYKVDGTEYALDTEKHLTAGASDTLSISAYMQETAGNKYMNMAIDSISITVLATQDTVEYDSFNNTYDENAPYPTAVSTESELLKALKNGENVVLNDDVYVQYGVSVPAGKNATIDLNGKTVTAKKNFVTVQTGGKLTVSGGTVTAGNYVFNVDGGEVVVNGGDYTAQECVFAVKQAGKLTINGGTFTAKDNSVVSTSGNIENAGSEITINGGVFNANIQSNGYIACGVYVANKDTVKINAGTFNVKNGIGVMMRAGNTTIGKDVVINLTSDSTVTAGKVADAALQINAGDYLVSDTKSAYPGLDDTFTITNNTSYALVEYK